MTNWQTFKVLSVGEYQRGGGTRFGYGYSIALDKHVEFSDGYKKSINVEYLGNKITGSFSCGQFKKPYIEIGIDRTKCMEKFYEIPDDAWRVVPNEVVSNRVLARAESLDPQVSARINDGVSRINRGEIDEFEDRMVDNSGNKHQFIYRKKY